MKVAEVVDAHTGTPVHTGRVSSPLERAVVVESPRGAAWHFRRRDGKGIGAVSDLRITGAWR